jgi:hypothetical protein
MAKSLDKSALGHLLNPYQENRRFHDHRSFGLTAQLRTGETDLIRTPSHSMSSGKVALIDPHIRPSFRPVLHCVSRASRPRIFVRLVLVPEFTRSIAWMIEPQTMTAVAKVFRARV